MSWWVDERPKDIWCSSGSTQKELMKGSDTHTLDISDLTCERGLLLDSSEIKNERLKQEVRKWQISDQYKEKNFKPFKWSTMEKTALKNSNFLITVSSLKRSNEWHCGTQIGRLQRKYLPSTGSGLEHLWAYLWLCQSKTLRANIQQKDHRNPAQKANLEFTC